VRHCAREGVASGSFELGWGTLVDPLTAVMLVVITFVSAAVQVYSLGYMRRRERGRTVDDPRIGWYFAVHSLFSASMLMLVLADNFLLLYVAWELVGLCSYLLIGFWFERRSAAEAAKTAFITTRIGDVGLLIGIVLLVVSLIVIGIYSKATSISDDARIQRAIDGTVDTEGQVFNSQQRQPARQFVRREQVRLDARAAA